MNYPSSSSIIISLLIFIILIIILYYYASKYIGKTNLYIITNILLLSLAINFITIFIMVMTYNKVKYTPGIVGPKGLRGENGFRGNDAEVEQCSKQGRNIGNAYIKKEKEKLIRIQKPVLHNN